MRDHFGAYLCPRGYVGRSLAPPLNWLSLVIVPPMATDFLGCGAGAVVPYNGHTDCVVWVILASSLARPKYGTLVELRATTGDFHQSGG